LARRVSQYLKIQALPLGVPRLDSIRSRILALAVFGTLLPAAITMGIGYRQNRRALQEKINADLHSVSAQAARAVSVEMKERLYDLRIYANSEEVTRNLSQFAAGQGSIPSMRLREYLRSLHEKSPDFSQLMVLDAQGRVLSSGGSRASAGRLPDDWQRVMRQENQAVGEAYWDDRDSTAKLVMAVPVQRPDGRLLGAFAAEITLDVVNQMLREFGADSGAGGGVYLTTEEGSLVASSRVVTRRVLGTRLSPQMFSRLRRAEHGTIIYTNMRGLEVIGTLEPVPQLRWMVIAEKSTEVAFAQVRSFRNIALVVIVLVLGLVAAVAYRLGLLIVRPLERLAQGAAVVAMGDLDVDLPSTDRGEVGALTSVFNHMVSRLREGRDALDRTNAELVSKNAELERLSVTDGLTGLTNHRSLMQRLTAEAVRSQRTDRSFVFLMADVDHFKQYNDTFGHPAGDEVLKRVAAILTEVTRSVDCVARYGGEEFALLLPETDMAGAMEVAERIRARVEAEDTPGRHVTLSLGVAEFPRDASDVAGIIAIADQALYVAKKAGRNQVAQGKRTRKQKLPAAQKKPAARKKR